MLTVLFNKLAPHQSCLFIFPFFKTYLLAQWQELGCKEEPCSLGKREPVRVVLARRFRCESFQVSTCFWWYQHNRKRWAILNGLKWANLGPNIIQTYLLVWRDLIPQRESHPLLTFIYLACLVIFNWLDGFNGFSRLSAAVVLCELPRQSF